jgi:hypothetical protein
MLRLGFKAALGPLAILFVICVLPAAASAQDNGLRIPTIAASAAAAADWASTYHALKYYKVREANPLLRPMDSSPLSMITVGGLIDMGAFSVWNVTVGRKHERVAAAGLWAMTAFRAYLVIHNIRNERRAQRR